MSTIIAPSILTMDFVNAKEQIEKIEAAGAEWLHFDVMDGNFVPNISFGLPIVEQFSKIHNMVNDVHIMIANPLKYAPEFVRAGANYLTFHYEACKDDKEVFQVIDTIHQFGAKAGLSIKPDTPVEKIFPFLYSLDLVLIMSVEPGFGGQQFMPQVLNKVIRLKDYFNMNQITKVLIEIDGGINEETAKLAKFAGVDVLVAGSYVLDGDNIEDRINSLR